MNLLLFHPQLLNRTCRRCQTWLYDDQHRIVTRLGRPVRRPSDSATPCWNCPKQSPAQAAGCERDIDQIESLVRFYFQVRATAGRSLTARHTNNPHLVRQLAIVDCIVRRWERTRANPAFFNVNQRSS